MTTKEIRALGAVEVRAADSGPPMLRGYAAVFNSPTEIAGSFREQIAPGAFAQAVTRDDVRALFNHDENFVLGRSTNGTLTMREDERGLFVEITPPDTTWALDLAASIRRGDVSQMSFAFRARAEQWSEFDADLPLRTLTEVELFDVSPVTYPAYADTSIAARSLADARAALAPQSSATVAIAARLRMKHGLRSR